MFVLDPKSLSVCGINLYDQIYFFDSKLYVFKKLTVYGYEFGGNSHHNYLETNNEHYRGQDQRLNMTFRLPL